MSDGEHGLGQFLFSSSIWCDHGRRELVQVSVELFAQAHAYQSVRYGRFLFWRPQRDGFCPRISDGDEVAVSVQCESGAYLALWRAEFAAAFALNGHHEILGTYEVERTEQATRFTRGYPVIETMET